MTFPQIRLLVSGLLLAGWLSYLGFLAATTTNPVVLSRPQFLVANLVVIGTVPALNSEKPVDVEIREVQFDPGNSVEPKQTIKVHFQNEKAHKYWTGPADYILVLSKKADGSYSITPIPLSPGYPNPSISEPVPRHWIYPVTPTTRNRMKRLLKKS